MAVTALASFVWLPGVVAGRFRSKLARRARNSNGTQERPGTMMAAALGTLLLSRTRRKASADTASIEKDTPPRTISVFRSRADVGQTVAKHPKDHANSG